MQYRAPPDMDKFNLYGLDVMVQDSSVQYKGPTGMNKFSLYSVDLIVQGPLYTVQGNSRHGQVQPVLLGSQGTGLICTVQGPPPDMDKFNLYSLDLILQGPLYTVQGP